MSSIKEKFNQLNIYLKKHIYIEFFVRAFLITGLIEILNRKSIIKAFAFLGLSPLAFLINMLIVTMTLAMSLLFIKKWKFAEDFITTVWITLGCVNFYILGYRMTPFSAEDLKLIPMLFKVAKHYLTFASAALMIAGAALLIFLITLLWRKTPTRRARVSIGGVLSKTAAIALVLVAALNMGMKTQALSENFENLAEAYNDYGFAYCFSNSVVDKGISKPSGYSEASMDAIAAKLRGSQLAEASAETKEAEVHMTADLSLSPEDRTQAFSAADLHEEDTDVKTGAADTETEMAETEPNAAEEEAGHITATPEHPNIIMIQLESFFDPTYIMGMDYSEDPIPNFRRLKEEGAYGYLYVPVVGAGTANSEFEILTGMSTDYFGAGEYPYNTVLGKTTAESIPFILRKFGYVSSVIHNNTGTFYNRHKVFCNLGFDYFIPEEYMYGLEFTPTDWAKDKVLPENIMESLQRTSDPDFIYVITVQSHGRYPSENLLGENPKIRVKADPVMYGENFNVNPLQYYVNQEKDVDDMIGTLLGDLEKNGEPTLLVMYGDHLPALGFDETNLTQPGLYQTEYVCWNNFGLELKKQDVDATSLSTYILQQFGMDDGIMPRFHELYDGKEGYDESLKMLEYDMLYGDGYIFQAFDDKLPLMKKEGEDARAYTATDLKFGVKPITVSECKIVYSGDIDTPPFSKSREDSAQTETADGGGISEKRSLKDASLYVYGENFNQSTRIVINDSVRDTLYIDEHTVQLDGKVPADMSTIRTGQFDNSLEELGTGSNVIYPQLADE